MFDLKKSISKHARSTANVLACLVGKAQALPTLLKTLPHLVSVGLAKRFFAPVKKRLPRFELIAMAGVFLLSGTFALAATPPNTQVTNIASANYIIGGTNATVTGSVSMMTAARTPAVIDFLQYIPQGTGGVVENVALSYCNGIAMPAPNYIMPPSTALTVPGGLRLAPATEYVKGDPIFIKVTDYDQNKNPNLAETIQLTIGSGTDTEQLTLTETGLSTGVFIGYIQSKAVAGPNNDCQLSVAGSNTRISATYTDPLDALPTVVDQALVDPFGVIFNSNSGLGVDGGKITMIDISTGLPATVYCDDGVTVLPQPLTAGSPTICDPIVSAGTYRFPRALPGNYRFQLVSPAGYAFPSTTPLTGLPSGFSIFGTLAGNGASYGGPFPLNLGPALHIDIPTDPSSGNLQIIKTAAKTIVGEGEFVPYALTIKNVSGINALNVLIADQLPIGFRYRANSASVNSTAIANPAISPDGRTLTFNVGSLNAGLSITLKYVVEVTPSAKAGPAENIAYATGGHQSNTAKASVVVREDLMRSMSILIGTVFLGSCDDTPPKGMPNIRIVLENGAYVLTDDKGQWHMDNVTPGTHVVQLDKDSVPKGYEVIDCQGNNRLAGRNYSQFVNLRGGSLWRANFNVQRKASNEQDTTATEKVLKTAQSGGAEKRGLVEKLPYDADWLAVAQDGPEWLHPSTGFSPALPVIKFAVKHHPSDTVKVTMNGTDVGGYNYDGTQNNLQKTVALSVWSGVSLKENENTLSIEVVNQKGLSVLQETRTIYYSEGPAKVELVLAKSKLIADGKTEPIIAVRFLDRFNHPARRGINGEYQLNAPYQSVTQQEAMRRDATSANINQNKPRFDIDDDGIAYIHLAPTTQTGEAVLSFDFGQSKLTTTINQNSVSNENQVRAWLVAGARDWILVGFAQGTLGHKALSGNVQGAKDSLADSDLFDQNRAVFYAKGTVQGDALLTVAYDSAKKRSDIGASPGLKQAVEPDKFYTLYADATQPYFDAASARKLYVKIERAQFYAMFGDFDTGLTVTEFARYNRTLNGVKSEYKDPKLSYNVFASMTAQTFKKDEIPGNGTSGTYKLSSGKIVLNSDKIRTETRDRFHSEVILKTNTLTRFIDYNIDYNLGTVFFNSPVSTRDFNLNPIFIVAEYEASDNKDEKLTIGGRLTANPSDKVVVGVTSVREGNIGAKGNLSGVDMVVTVNEKTKAVAEFAQSTHESSAGIAKGSAWKAEIVHSGNVLDAKAYIREQGSGFGLNQQAAAETGTRKIGAEARYKVSQEFAVQGQIYEQTDLGKDAKRDVLEIRVDQKVNDSADVFYGARSVHEKDAAGIQAYNNQFIGGVTYSVLDKNALLKASTELNTSKSSQSTDFPNRYLLGADYKLSEQTQLFAQYEMARSDLISTNNAALGLRVKPWTGAEASAKLGNAIATDSQRIYSDFGLSQRWKIDDFWQTDVALQRVQVLSASSTAGSPNFSAGAITGNSTAASIGVAYSEKIWSANGRLETRIGADKNTNLAIGGQRTLDDGMILATSLSIRKASDSTSDTRNSLARVSFAHRPLSSQWSWLNRLDYVDDALRSNIVNNHTRKLVNSTHLNWLPSVRTQWSFQYAGKYVFDTIDGAGYRGYTDLIAAEVRRDLLPSLPSWDVGAHAARLHSYSSRTQNLSAGVSIGYKLFNNAWISVGYNVLGFNDADFIGANYRSKGAYLTLRMKVDQDSLNLNSEPSAQTLQSIPR
jgi:uncharacterized repeat protein (TIGR01451 family)